MAVVYNIVLPKKSSQTERFTGDTDQLKLTKKKKHKKRILTCTKLDGTKSAVKLKTGKGAG